jgi:hypothetical protein
MAAKVASVTLVQIDPTTLKRTTTKFELKNAVIAIDFYDASGKIIEPSQDSPIVFEVEVEDSSKPLSLAYVLF